MLCNFARYYKSMTTQKILFFCFILTHTLLFVGPTNAQNNNATIKGFVKDEKGKPIELVNVGVLNTTIGTVSEPNGYYEIKVPEGKTIVVVFSMVGYESKTFEFLLTSGEVKTVQVQLKIMVSNIPIFDVIEDAASKEGMTKIDLKVVNHIPGPGGIEKALLLQSPGVTSSSELSSTYSVRGGNFDENLVYINDIEVYRPFLIRAGQQEGLSFLNSDLAGSVLFSSGGFDASYGDKTASVLDVRYKTPQKFAGSFVGGLLGANMHLEGISENKKFTWLTGVRYKTSKYILSAMETQGNYNPNFIDVQTFLTYSFTKKTSLSWLGYISKNTFNLIPETRETSFGTINEAYRLTVFFDGEEIDQFNLYKNAFVLSHNPSDSLQLKFIATAFVSDETETYDILGQYYIGRLETDFGKPGFGDVAENRGVGAFLNHSRNYLTASVVNVEHRGKYFGKKWTYQWGAKVQYEKILDRINEWTYLDSAGYSIPHHPDSVGYTNPNLQPYQTLTLKDTLRSQIEISSLRYSGFVMASRTFDIDSTFIIFNAGVRTSFWDVNNQLLISPRASVSVKPKKQPRVTYRLASGIYNQPPFYRELRNLDGSIDTDVKAQQSIHFVAATDVDLSIWRRPFKYSAEIYYKHLNNLVPYIIDNVRIRYLPHLSSSGYAAGIDMKINGEFVPGIQSWVNVSVMQTREDIKGDFYEILYNTDGERIVPGYTFNDTVAYGQMVNPGFIPRPTDQRVTFSLFFQDYLPNNPSFRMHLGLFFGSRLPFGPPGAEKYKHLLRMPAYKRVDVGFSKQLISEGGETPKSLSKIKNAFITLEIFNLLQINNTISYLWIMDVTGRYYAIPNYLTPRQLNFKLIVEF